MTIAMQAIYTQTVGVGGQGGLAFNNIPQNFTDLYLVASTRMSGSPGPFSIALYFNTETYPGSTTYTSLFANGSTTISNRSGGYGTIGDSTDADSTSNTFSSHSVYISNYTSANFKQIVVDAVKESDSSIIQNALGMHSVLWRSTAAINRLFLDPYPTAFAANSTFTLYGITKG